MYFLYQNTFNGPFTSCDILKMCCHCCFLFCFFAFLAVSSIIDVMEIHFSFIALNMESQSVKLM